MSSRRRRLWKALAPIALALLPALPAGCGEAAPPQPAAPKAEKPAPPPATAVVAAPPEPPMPELRTGGIEPVVHASPLQATIVERQIEGDHEILQLQLSMDGLEGSRLDINTTEVDIERAAGEPAPLAFMERRGGRGGASLWIRRPSGHAGKPVAGTIFTPARYERWQGTASPGHRFRFEATAAGAAPPVVAPRAAGTKAAASKSALFEEWTKALAEHFQEGTWRSAWHSFAAQRVLALAARASSAGANSSGRPSTPRRPRGDELAMLMDTTTGMTSLQETLQHDRGLFIAASEQKATIPIAAVAGPKLALHPFREMLAELNVPVPAEPLAELAPAEFYYIRFDGMGSLFRLIDESDAWGTPIANALDERSEDRGLSVRYETSLGLGRGPLTRALGPEVIDQVAIVGSDPYLKEGSDVTLVFQVKKKALFEAGMASALAGHGQAHGGITMASATFEGVDIKIGKSADGAVTQHRISSGDREIVSNSLGAVKRVIEVIKGKRARLSEEPDFRFMLARDAKTRADVLAFLGDRFVAEVVGPRQKILEARRQMAVAELSTPGYASLLFGWIWGRSPASAEELIKVGLLSKEELKHAGGEAIAFRPGEAARSAWGSPAALTPLIDLPSITTVTEAERDGYAGFVRTYQQYWSTFMDPIMVRLAIDAPEGGRGAGAISADVRVLPLIDATEYREIEAQVGRARIQAPPLGSGARVVLGVGADAELRRELTRELGSGIFGRGGLKLDWLGDWAMVGIADRPSAARAFASAMEEEVPGRPKTAEEREKDARRSDAVFDDVARIPGFAAIGIRSTAGAGLAVAALRAIAKDALPGMVEWGEHGKHRAIPIVRISIENGGGWAQTETPVEVFYAFCEGALIASMREDLLRALIDERLDKKGPGPAPASGAGEAPQLAVDIAPGERGPLRTVLTWYLEQRAIDTARWSRTAAEALLRGAPERAGDAAAMRALGLAVLGSAPMTPDGQAYSLGRDGPRDPARGTPHAPMWPAVPVPGSPVEKVMSSLSGLRTELAFDDEVSPKGATGPRPQSLHARVRLSMRR